MTPMWILIAVVAAVAIYLIATYNGFVRLVKRAEEAWSDIDVQLKRRYDLIPNLINAVKGYASHETSVFEKVTEARTRAMNANTGTAAEQGAAENMLTDTLKTLFAVSENYPDLKANTNFLELQRELSDTENKIQASRRFYNGTVMELNTKVDSFPGNVIAPMFNFSKREFFEVTTEAEKNPVAVQF